MTNAKSVTELFNEVQEIFEEFLACEIPDHGDSWDHPDPNEPGSWYITAKCPYCDFGGTSLICNTFRNLTVESLAKGRSSLCPTCKQGVPDNQFITSIIRRGERL